MNREELIDWIETTGTLQFSRSAGPGGQNVNKLNTRVTLTLPLRELPGISEADARRLESKLSNRLTADGELQIHSQESRSQLRNRETTVQRALDLILAALEPRRRRIATRPSAASKARRIEGKKQRGQIKKRRKPPEPD